MYCSNEALLVRTFILAIARYVPERSPRVLPLLQKLTSLVHDKLPALLPETDSHKTADFGTFIMDVFRRLGVAIPGATEDLANLSWDQLPLVPTTSEMLNDNCDDRKYCLYKYSLGCQCQIGRLLIIYSSSSAIIASR